MLPTILFNYKPYRQQNIRNIWLDFYAYSFTANLKHFFCNEIKIINREMFEPYDLSKDVGASLKHFVRPQKSYQ